MTSHKSFPINLPECDLIDNFILKRLNQGLSTHILVTGLGGKGKSSFSVRTAERLTKRIKNGIEFTHKDIVDSFLKLLERITRIKKPGEIIVVEEISVLFPARRAMAEDNVAIGRVLDTLRKRRVILISNAPLYPSIESHMRAMADILVECKKVIKSEELVKLKAWKLNTSPHSGKTYRHRFKRKKKDVLFHYSKKPNNEIWMAYEKEKDKFLIEIYQKMKRKTEKKMEKENRELKGGLSEKDKRNRLIWHKYNVEKKPLRQIAIEEGLSEPSISQILKKINETGDFFLEKLQNSGLNTNLGTT